LDLNLDVTNDCRSRGADFLRFIRRNFRGWKHVGASWRVRAISRLQLQIMRPSRRRLDFAQGAKCMIAAADLDLILCQHPEGKREHLIPLLQEVQDAQGYLSREAVLKIGRHLELPASKIYGVATFYNQFRFLPRGKYHLMVCRGTACHVKGSARVLDTVMQSLSLKPGQTSRDKLFSLEVVACMGACGLAPVVNMNGEFFAKATPKKLTKIIAESRETEVARVNS
jgi:NADH-quinone oxidoreductase subunit E